MKRFSFMILLYVLMGCSTYQPCVVEIKVNEGISVLEYDNKDEYESRKNYLLNFTKEMIKNRDCFWEYMDTNKYVDYKRIIKRYNAINSNDICITKQVSLDFGKKSESYLKSKVIDRLYVEKDNMQKFFENIPCNSVLQSTITYQLFDNVSWICDDYLADEVFTIWVEMNVPSYRFVIYFFKIPKESIELNKTNTQLWSIGFMTEYSMHYSDSK